MEKECFTCAWHDNFSWVCFNGNSEHRADFTDPEDSCPVWEGREDSDEKEEKLVRRLRYRLAVPAGTGDYSCRGAGGKVFYCSIRPAGLVQIRPAEISKTSPLPYI